jgi:hypothetical protein
MSSKTINISEETLINFLKSLPEESLIDILINVLVENDTTRLTEEEKDRIIKAKDDLKSGDLVDWKDIR